MVQPIAVATSTSRRQRRGFCTANCWARPPPQETPSTSTRSYPSVVSIGRPAGPAAGRGRAAAAPASRPARHVEADHLDRGVERVDERLEAAQARADAVAQQQRRPVGVGAGADGDAQPPSARR